MAQMTTTNGADTLQVYVVRKTLEYAKPKLIYSQFGAPDLSLARKGKTASWLRFNKMSIPASALAESPTWVPETITDVTVTATLELWGNGMEMTEFLDNTSFLDLPNEFKDLVGQNAGETINQLVRDVLVAGTSVTYANAKASRGALTSVDTVDMDDFLSVAQSLEAADAPKIGDAYVAIISPYVKTQLMKDTAFREATRYLGKENMLFTGELVNIDGIKFVVTSTAPTVSNSGSNNAVATVEQSVVIGKNAYGIARLLPGDFKVVVTPPGGHGDEYEVKTSIAWKCYLKTVILNQTFMRRLESAR
jgi:N4-gp56 family major capsid protein